MASAMRKWPTCDLGAYLQWLKDNELKSITLKYCASGAEVYELSSLYWRKSSKQSQDKANKWKNNGKASVEFLRDQR